VELGLAAEAHTARVGIIRSAAGDWEDAGACYSDLVLGRGGRGLRGSNCTGEDEDGDESTDDMFHSEIPLKLYLLRKISLDKPDVVTIGYIMD
jgi:hypothetical protein